MYCTKCGNQLKETDKFCSQCGSPAVVEEFVPAFKKDMMDAQPVAPSTPASEDKPEKVYHHDEFDWNLEGYPQENRTTDDINFDWNSVVRSNERRRGEAFVGFRSDALKSEEPKVEEKPQQKNDSLEEFLFGTEVNEAEHLSGSSAERNKSEERVDKFFTFNKKNAEFQALLDQEFARLRKAESERHGTVMSDEELKIEEELIETVEPEIPVVTEIETESEPEVQTGAEKENEAEDTDIEDKETEETVKSVETLEPAETPLDVEETEAENEDFVEDAKEETSEEPKMEAEEDTSEEPEEIIPQCEPELVEVVWASAPAGFVVERETTVVPEAEKTDNVEETATPEEAQEENTEEVSDAKELPPSEEPKKAEQKLTFDDVFSDDDEDDSKPKTKGKGFLRFITVVLLILVIVELAMIGIQYFAPDSEAAAIINQGYTKVIAMIKGEKEAPAPTEPDTSVVIQDQGMIQQLIDANKGNAANIVKIKYSSEAVFEEDQDYGFEEFNKSYEFTDAPWYTNDDGETVTYGQEIVRCIVGYYDNYVNQLNGRENEILNYVDQTSDFYQSVVNTSGDEGAEYGINTLEIGKIRTSGSGFYVRVNTDLANSLEGASAVTESIVYIEPFNKEMKIADIKDL